MVSAAIKFFIICQECARKNQFFCEGFTNEIGGPGESKLMSHITISINC